MPEITTTIAMHQDPCTCGRRLTRTINIAMGRNHSVPTTPPRLCRPSTITWGRGAYPTRVSSRTVPMRGRALTCTRCEVMRYVLCTQRGAIPGATLAHATPCSSLRLSPLMVSTGLSSQWSAPEHKAITTSSGAGSSMKAAYARVDQSGCG